MSARRFDASRAALELFAASGFAIAQPVLSVYGKSADTFIYRDVHNTEIVLFALALAFLPPLGLWIVEVVVGFVNRPRAGSCTRRFSSCSSHCSRCSW